MNRESILKDIKNLKQEIDRLEELNKILDSESSSFEEMVFKKYIQMESTTKVAKFLRENGYKRQVFDKQYSFKPADIREIVLDERANVSKVLKHYCLIIFNRNSKAVSRYW